MDHGTGQLKQDLLLNIEYHTIDERFGEKN